MMFNEITFLAAHGEHRETLFRYAAEGLAEHGVKSIMTTGKHAYTPLVACWGWKMGQRAQAAGHDVLVFENGYLGDRSKWISVAWNGLNGRGEFWVPPDVSDERFNTHFKMKPWRKTSGKYILCMGQVVGDMSLMGEDLTGWYNSIAQEARKYYKLPVLFRPHPVGYTRRGNFEPNIEKIEGALEEALDNAHLVITYNSNSAVNSVLHGIPALSFDIGSMAYEVTGHHITERLMPDRSIWAARLAHRQYTREEIQKGLFWENLKKRLE